MLYSYRKGLKGAAMAKIGETVKREEVCTDEAFEILQRALERPGVREMMSVYQQWEAIEGAVRAYSQTITPRTVMAATDTSVPPALQRL